MGCVTWSAGSAGSAAAAVCLCSVLSALLAPGDAIFLAPCLWRQTRSLRGPGVAGGVAGGAPVLLRSRRFLSTDADACTNLCRIPLFPSTICQRCCQAAGLPVPANTAIPGIPGIIANLGITGTGAQSLPLVPLTHLQALLNQLLASGYLTAGSLSAIAAGALRPVPSEGTARPVTLLPTTPPSVTTTTVLPPTTTTRPGL